MTEHTIRLDWLRPPMTSNQQRRAHWTAVRAAKAEVGERVRLAAKQDRIPTVTGCKVTVVWFTPDRRRRDPDSLGPFLKAALDGLVAAGVLADDCVPHVVETSMRIEVDRDAPRIEIEIQGGTHEC
jgi:crossover junction endodeoxyribonuclease RusA